MEVRNNVSFGARYIGPAKIKIKNGKNWKDVDLSFIKLNTASRKDAKALSDIATVWGEQNLSSGINEEVRILGRKAQVYAVTAQKSGFENVIPQSVLGLMSTDKIGKMNDAVEIFKIGTAPQFAYEQNGRSRDIKHIARGMVEAFRNFVNGRNKGEVIVNYAEPQELKFLNKVGLEPKKSLSDLAENRFVG